MAGINSIDPRMAAAIAAKRTLAGQAADASDSANSEKDTAQPVTWVNNQGQPVEWQNNQGEAVGWVNQPSANNPLPAQPTSRRATWDDNGRWDDKPTWEDGVEDPVQALEQYREQVAVKLSAIAVEPLTADSTEVTADNVEIDNGYVEPGYVEPGYVAPSKGQPLTLNGQPLTLGGKPLVMGGNSSDTEAGAQSVTENSAATVTSDATVSAKPTTRVIVERRLSGQTADVRDIARVLATQVRAEIVRLNAQKPNDETLTKHNEFVDFLEMVAAGLAELDEALARVSEPMFLGKAGRIVERLNVAVAQWSEREGANAVNRAFNVGALCCTMWFLNSIGIQGDEALKIVASFILGRTTK